MNPPSPLETEFRFLAPRCLVPIIAKLIKGGMRIAKSNCAFATKPILWSIAAFFFLLAGLAGLTGVFMGGPEVRAGVRAPQPMCTPCPGATATGLARKARVSATPAAIPPPTCPGPECEKKITIFNNTDGTIWVAIQAGFQNPDPWLQALFGNNQQSYAETHLSRVYPTYPGGIPAGGHIRVTVPWYSELQGDVDQYVDWFNGGRIVIFDSFEAVERAHDQDRNRPLTVTGNSPTFCCEGCDAALSIYGDPVAYDDTKIPFQLAEYTFVNVTGNPPYIIDLHVDYDTSDVDQLYLPVAISPCSREPVSGTCRPDPNALGYLGTTLSVEDFSRKASRWLDYVGWVRYKSDLDSDSHPRIPAAYLVLIDQVNVSHGSASLYTCVPPQSTVRDMIHQWQTCTVGNPNSRECPQANLYKELNDYFQANYSSYWNGGTPPAPCMPPWPEPSPSPGSNYPSPLEVMPFVYGWVPFNRDCTNGDGCAKFNDLLCNPGPADTFNQVKSDYIEQLQYNYKNPGVDKSKWFNAYTELVHEELNANVYAFSIDDAAGNQNQPGEGIVLAIGGSNGLPNPHPIPPPTPPVDFSKDFALNLGDSIALSRPCWQSYSVCGGPEMQFPPPTYNSTTRKWEQAPSINVNTRAHHISPLNPCTITIKDAANQMYQFKVKMAVPWPEWNPPLCPGQPGRPPSFDPNVVEAVSAPSGWFGGFNEQANPTPVSCPGGISLARSFILSGEAPADLQPRGRFKCPSPSPSPSPSPTPTPTGTPTPAQSPVCGNPTPTGTPSPSPTASPTPTPTSTPCPP